MNLVLVLQGTTVRSGSTASSLSDPGALIFVIVVLIGLMMLYRWLREVTPPPPVPPVIIPILVSGMVLIGIFGAISGPA